MDKEIMLRLRLDGYTYAHIAQLAGVSRQRVQKILSPPRGVAHLITEKYNDRCVECQLVLNGSGHIHQVGATNGDTYNDSSNLVLLCASCHRKQHRGSGKSFRINSGTPAGPEITAKELLQQLRDKGWGDSDIGNALGVDRVTVFHWRTGRRSPQAEPMVRDALRRLLRRTGPPRRKEPAGI